VSDSAGSTTTPGPVPEPGPVPGWGAVTLTRRETDALCSVLARASVPVTSVYGQAAGDWVFGVASYVRDRQTEQYRRHLDLAAAERERLASEGGEGP
jgi:hypothetical protein